MPDWPSPSWISRLLFETWWPGLAVFLVAAAMLGYQALQRRHARLAIAAGICALIAGLFPLLAFTVTTVRETVIARSRQLAEAGIPPLDAAALRRLLAERVVFEAPRGQTLFTRRDEILQLAERADRRWTVAEWGAITLDGRRLDDNHAQSYARVRTRLTARGQGVISGGEFAVTSGWLIDWRQVDDRWRADRITLLTINGQAADPALLP